MTGRIFIFSTEESNSYSHCSSALVHKKLMVCFAECPIKIIHINFREGDTFITNLNSDGCFSSTSFFLQEFLHHFSNVFSVLQHLFKVFLPFSFSKGIWSAHILVVFGPFLFWLEKLNLFPWYSCLGTL